MFDEVAQLIQADGKEIFQNRKSHINLMNTMSKLIQNFNSIKQWLNGKKNYSFTP